MADFCNQCADSLGFQRGDLAGLTKPEDQKHDMYCAVICEGCGFIQVDTEGNCVSPDCLGHDHGGVTGADL